MRTEATSYAIAQPVPRNFIYRFDMAVRRFCGVGSNGPQPYTLPTFHFHVRQAGSRRQLH